jgi:hypothetical protein
MVITRQIIAGKIASYLHHELRLDDLVAWAEEQIIDGEFDSPESRDVAARIGLADVRAFGLTWEDCKSMLQKLGFRADMQIGIARK